MECRKQDGYFMKQINDYSVDFSTALLSALDLSGSLVFSSLDYRTNGIHQDMQNLKNDLNVLEDDYLKAIEKLSRNEEISNGQLED